MKITKSIGKILSFVLIISCILTLNTAVVFADEAVVETDIITSSYIISQINKYKTSNITYTIAAKKELHSFDTDRADYTYFALSPYGYAILLNQTAGLLEACYTPDASDPVDVMDGSTYYYGGPGNCYRRTEDCFLNTISGNVLDLELTASLIKTTTAAKNYELNKHRVLKEKRSLETTSLQRGNTETDYNTLTASAQYNYFSNLTEFGQNAGSTCTTIAFAILFGFYDQFVDDDFVASIYEDGDGTNEAFHQHLISYVYEGGQPTVGKSPYDAAPFLNDYLSNRSVTFEVIPEDLALTTNADIVSTTIYLLEKGIPSVISIGQHTGATIDHSYVAYSVTYDITAMAETAVFVAHSGWHNGQTEVVISGGLIWGSAYLQCDGTSHYYTDWEDYGSTKHIRYCDYCFVVETGDHTYFNWTDQDMYYHTRTCRHCSHEEAELHEDYWNETLSKCTRCGRTGYIGLKLVNMFTEQIELFE